MNAPIALRPARPYPGLRPFEADEWSIFFGRERMIDEVIDRLADTRLALIHGASGSGKSSLVRAGVLPKLARQHQRSGSPWRTCAMRPAGGPLWNLATEFAALEGRGEDVERIGAIVLRFSARGASLAGVAASLDGMQGRSLCLLVDQFEEVFRFEKETSREEAELFVDLIGRATDEPQPTDADVRVVVTMRSEFLGECSRFAGLAETINRTQYLVPRLDDEALARAVRRPAALYRGSIEPALADRLIASVRGREDELPLLQHGLMLMWDEAVRKAGDGPPRLDGQMVDEAGGLAELLSRHADSVMREAAPGEAGAKLVERLFRELTDVNAEGAAIRRPRRLADLARAIGVGADDLRPILDAFRAPGVSFLTPYAPAPVKEPTQIDISHEALIRCWSRVARGPDGWLRAEFEDGLAWRSLLVEAHAFEHDSSRVLSPAATVDRGGLVASRNEAWSDRYGGGWGDVVALLAASGKAAAATRRQRRRRMALMSAVTVGALGFAAIAGWEWRQAESATAMAQAQTRMAKKEEDAARLAVEAMSAIEENVEHWSARKKAGGSPEQELFRSFKLSADNGNSYSLFILGNFYSVGLGTAIDYGQAMAAWQEAGRGGVPRALTDIGWLYANGYGVPQDYVQAREWYERAAAEGDTTAMFNLAILYNTGQGVGQNYAVAREWDVKAAAAGKAEAMIALGTLYLNGQGVAQDAAKAREWYEKAAVAGGANAMSQLGNLFAYGQGVAKDYPKAREWYEKAAAAGNSNAMYRLGILYANGYGVTQDYAKAREWYEKAAAAGEADAMTTLGFLYKSGQGVAPDFTKAREWYEKGAAAGDATAMFDLGVVYGSGQGVARDYATAREWYEKAAAAGDIDAMTNIGVLYKNGQGVTQDFAKAREWYEKAAAAGDSLAMTNLGNLYSNGQGVAQDYATAMEWYRKAAAKDEPTAIYNIGFLYANGRGVAQDYVKAREWYEKAAAAGDSTAMYDLGVFYENGRGVAQDYAKAREWYEKAAAAGDVSAMTNLGFHYENGLGVPQDYVKAQEWYEKAAAAGGATAMTNLGFHYESGRGVPQDYAKAREWYEKAAAAGGATAMTYLGDFYRLGQGVPQDYAKAREWYEKAAVADDATAMYQLSLLFSQGKGGGPADPVEALHWALRAAYQMEAENASRAADTKDLLVRALISVEWNALLAHEFAKALTAAERAHDLIPGDLISEGNHAHALMFLDRTDEARALYLSHRDEKLAGSDSRSWREAVLDDFAEFRKTGLDVPLMSEIEAAFASP